MVPAASEYVCQLVECMLPGVTAEQARALDGRVREHASAAMAVSYLGAVLMPDDEVLFCLFAGPAGEVRAVSERAGVCFERILPCRAIGLLAPPPDSHEG
jgi:hypothetical protein